MLEVGDQKAAAALDPDLARLEQGGEIRAVVRLGALRHQALVPHRLERLEHLLDAVAGQRRVVAVGGQDLGARRHHHRRSGEDVAAGARAREIEAVGVGAQRVDLLRVLVDLADRARRLVRIEARLLEQILVPDQDRNVRRESRAVDLALVGRDVLVGLSDGSVIRIGLEVSGEVGEEAGLHEIGHVDEIEGDEVGNLARLNAGGELGDHLVVGDGGELDLVAVRRVPKIDEMRRGVGAAGAHPHRHRVGESHVAKADEAISMAASRAACPPHGHDVPPCRRENCFAWLKKLLILAVEKSFSQYC